MRQVAHTQAPNGLPQRSLGLPSTQPTPDHTRPRQSNKSEHNQEQSFRSTQPCAASNKTPWSPGLVTDTLGATHSTAGPTARPTPGAPGAPGPAPEARGVNSREASEEPVALPNVALPTINQPPTPTELGRRRAARRGRALNHIKAVRPAMAAPSPRADTSIAQFGNSTLRRNSSALGL